MLCTYVSELCCGSVCSQATSENKTVTTRKQFLVSFQPCTEFAHNKNRNDLEFSELDKINLTLKIYQQSCLRVKGYQQTTQPFLKQGPRQTGNSASNRPTRRLRVQEADVGKPTKQAYLGQNKAIYKLLMYDLVNKRDVMHKSMQFQSKICKVSGISVPGLLRGKIVLLGFIIKATCNAVNGITQTWD